MPLRTVAIVVPISPTEGFLGQVAVLHRALERLPWRNWRWQLHLSIGGTGDLTALDRWRPHLGCASFSQVSAERAEREGIWAQADDQLRCAPRDADVVVAMDADVLPVSSLEPVLDRVHEAGAAAGVMAHLPFPGWPGRSSRENWAEAASGLTSSRIFFDHTLSLAEPDAPDDQRLSPFYVNYGVVFLAGSALERILSVYFAYRQALERRLPVPHFSAQVGLALAVSETGVPALSLPIRYNFPNDERAVRLHAGELEQVVAWHYLRTTSFDRQQVFASASAYEAFLGLRLDGVDRRFQAAARQVVGASWPFGATGQVRAQGRPHAETLPPAVNAGPAAQPTSLDDALAAYRATVAPLLQQMDTDAHTAPNEAQARLRARRTLLASGLFAATDRAGGQADAGPESILARVDGYLQGGEERGSRAGGMFDPAFYRRHYLTGAAEDTNALVHYLDVGRHRGALPSAAFVPALYLKRHGLSPWLLPSALVHWVLIGRHLAQVSPALPGAEHLEAFRTDGPRNLFALMRFRQALVTAFGRDDGYEVYRAIVGMPATGALTFRRVTGQLAQAEVSADSNLHIINRDLVEARVSLARVHGEATHREISVRSRASYVASTRNARVRGASSLIDVGQSVLFDFEGDELRTIDTEFEFDAAVFAGGPDGVWVIDVPAGADVRQIPEAYSLLGARSVAFGHWMWEHLLKYAAARQDARLDGIPVLIESGLPPAHRRSIELLFPGTHIVEVAPFQPLHVDRLWFGPAPQFPSLIEKRNDRFTWGGVTGPAQTLRASAAAVRERAAAAVEGEGPSLVYLARQPWRHRQMTNASCVEAIVRGRGYTLAYPEDLDFAEQIRLVRSARRIVAPEGSAVALCMFAPRGAELVILNGPDADMLVSYQPFFDAIGVRLSVMAGRLVREDRDWPEWSDFEIPVGDLGRLLETEA